MRGPRQTIPKTSILPLRCVPIAFRAAVSASLTSQALQTQRYVLRTSWLALSPLALAQQSAVELLHQADVGQNDRGASSSLNSSIVPQRMRVLCSMAEPDKVVPRRVVGCASGTRLSSERSGAQGDRITSSRTINGSPISWATKRHRLA
jgi:hypothetical protein